MAEVDFERRLDRLFGEAPGFPDAEVFATGVENRLARGWATRRWLIGAAGLVGGVIAASQLFMINFVQRVESVETSARSLGASLADLAPAGGLMTLSHIGVGMWTAVGLAAVTLSFVLSRVIEEI